MRDNGVRWVVAIVAALAIIALLAWDRGEPGDDGRAPDPESALAALVLPGADLL